MSRAVAAPVHADIDGVQPGERIRRCERRDIIREYTVNSARSDYPLSENETVVEHAGVLFLQAGDVIQRKRGIIVNAEKDVQQVVYKSLVIEVLFLEPVGRSVRVGSREQLRTRRGQSR